jgi:hypothetical protein
VDPRSPANRGWGWGWTPDPRRIGGGTPIPDPRQIGGGGGGGDRGFRALPSRLRPRARAHTPLPSAARRPPRRAGLREWHGAPVPRLGPTPDLGASGLSLGLRLPEALRLSLSLTSPGQNRDRILARPGRVPWKVAYLQLESEATTRAAAARTVTWCATWTVSRTALAQWPQPGPWKRLT